MEKKFILVAEDDKVYADIYSSVFDSSLYDVVVVKDGSLVVPELSKRKPDLMLLDLVMPGKSGFDILREIRETDSLKDLKVVVVSNLSQEYDIEKTRHLGVLEYIVKSDLSIHELREKVKKYLG